MIDLFFNWAFPEILIQKKKFQFVDSCNKRPLVFVDERSFMLIHYSRFITQPKRPLTKINRMCSDKSLFGDPAGIRTPDPLLKRQLVR